MFPGPSSVLNVSVLLRRPGLSFRVPPCVALYSVVPCYAARFQSRFHPDSPTTTRNSLYVYQPPHSRRPSTSVRQVHNVESMLSTALSSLFLLSLCFSPRHSSRRPPRIPVPDHVSLVCHVPVVTVSCCVVVLCAPRAVHDSSRFPVDVLPFLPVMPPDDDDYALLSLSPFPRGWPLARMSTFKMNAVVRKRPSRDRS